MGRCALQVVVSYVLNLTRRSLCMRVHPPGGEPASGVFVCDCPYLLHVHWKLLRCFPQLSCSYADILVACEEGLLCSPLSVRRAEFSHVEPARAFCRPLMCLLAVAALFECKPFFLTTYPSLCHHGTMLFRNVQVSAALACLGARLLLCMLYPPPPPWPSMARFSCWSSSLALTSHVFLFVCVSHTKCAGRSGTTKAHRRTQRPPHGCTAPPPPLHIYHPGGSEKTCNERSERDVCRRKRHSNTLLYAYQPLGNRRQIDAPTVCAAVILSLGRYRSTTLTTRVPGEQRQQWFSCSSWVTRGCRSGPVASRRCFARCSRLAAFTSC